MMSRVYLSRRNLLVLLAKLGKRRAGELTACSHVKNDNRHPRFPQTMKSVEVIAVEDDEYYAHRAPGEVCPADEPPVIL